MGFTFPLAARKAAEPTTSGTRSLPASRSRLVACGSCRTRGRANGRAPTGPWTPANGRRRPQLPQAAPQGSITATSTPLGLTLPPLSLAIQSATRTGEFGIGTATQHSRLNTWPTRSPVNASDTPSRTNPHDSGPPRVASPSVYGSLIRCTSPVLTGATYRTRFHPTTQPAPDSRAAGGQRRNSCGRGARLAASRVDRVGSRAGAVPLRLWLGRVRRFQLRARLALAVGPFPAPARSNRACGFPAHGFPARFAPRVMRRITLAALSAVPAPTEPGSRRTVRAVSAATAYSTCSSRSHCVSSCAGDVAAPSSPPTPGCS